MQVLIDRSKEKWEGAATLAEKEKNQSTCRCRRKTNVSPCKEQLLQDWRRKGKNIHLYGLGRKGNGTLFGAMGIEKPIQILGLPAFLHGINERFWWSAVEETVFPVHAVGMVSSSVTSLIMWPVCLDFLVSMLVTRTWKWWLRLRLTYPGVKRGCASSAVWPYACMMPLGPGLGRQIMKKPVKLYPLYMIRST